MDPDYADPITEVADRVFGGVEVNVFASYVEGLVRSWARDPKWTRIQFERTKSEGLWGGSVDYWVDLLDDPTNPEWLDFVGRTLLSSWHRPS